MKRLLLLIAAVLSISAADVSAWPAHGSGVAPPPISTCPKGTADPNDGCQGASVTAQVQVPNLFTIARQQGQTYAATPSWNVAGVDYGVGATAPDASLLDVKQNIPSGHGCSISYLSHWVICSETSGSFSLSGLLFKGMAFYNNASDNFPISLDNMHFTLTANNCRNYSGSGYIRAGAGTGPLSVTNTTIDDDGTCVFNADLYKSSFDPGFASLSSGYSINIASSVLTIPSGTVTGRVYSGSYLDWSGRATSNKTLISGLTAPTSKTISSITISGTTATVTTATPHGLDVGAGLGMSGILPDGYNGDVEVDSIPDSTHFTYQIQAGNTVPGGSATRVTGTGVGYGIFYLSGPSALLGTWTVSGTTSNLATTAGASTGPVKANANGPIAMGSSGKVTLKYIASTNTGQLSSAINELDARWNYEKITSQTGQHVNFVFNAPQATSYTDFIEAYNTVWWDQSNEDEGTGTFDYFAASTASSGTGQATLSNLNLSNNVGIVNMTLCCNGVSGTTPALVRMLSQSSAAGNVGTTTYSLAAGGDLTVTAFTPSGTSVVQTLAPNVFVTCNANPGCTKPIQIIAQTKGTGGATCPDVTCTGTTGHYSVTNTTDTRSSRTELADLYPGAITTATLNNNYFDTTGVGASGNGNPWNFEVGHVPIGTINSTGNINMKSGASCNFGGSC